jgi:crossover junction endodeoxyribonuclease RuvC
VSNQQNSNILLGIDPGLRVAGYSVISCTGSRVQLIDLGFLEQKSSESVQHRVGRFCEFAEDKINEHSVNAIALETPFLGKNAQTFLKLGYLRGTLYQLAYKHKLELHEFAPRQIKQAITGSGAAQKDQVARALFMMFPGLTKFKCTVRNDVTDALGIGLCGAMQASSNLRSTLI